MELKFNYGKPRQAKLATLFFLLIVSIFIPAIVWAESFEVAPDVSAWREDFCKAGSENADIFAHCRATGGTPQGNIYNLDCIGGDPAGYQLLSAVEKARRFSLHRYNLCSEPNMTFSGWGHSPHSTYLCWSFETKYTLGFESWSTGNMTMNGVKGAACNENVTNAYSALRTRSVTCPAGSSAQGSGADARCFKSCPVGEVLIGNICMPPSDKNDCYLTDNPCNVATGNKYRSETDFSNNGLSFTRYYNSNKLVDVGLGRGWRSNYQRALYVFSDLIAQVSSNGPAEPWVKTGGVWQGDPDSDYILTEDASGYTLTKKDGAYESYDLAGRIVSMTNTSGHQTLFSYNEDGRLAQVSNHFGVSLTFDYKAGNLHKITDGLGAQYLYRYDAADNLIEVVMPDATPEDESDNLRKQYHYEDATFPNHLTGITDENGDRYGTFAYNTDGKAASSELAVTSNPVGQERIDLSYNTGNTVVTDAVGNQDVWVFDEILNANKLVSKTNQSDGKAMSQTWDANGNKLSRTDAEGRVTSYTYNAHNQKTSMTEASGSQEARTTTYEYVSADIDLVTKTMTPSVYSGHTKEVINTYDANQNITSVVTNGFNATGVAVTRATTFQYDVYGKVTQVDGPRTDVNDITTLEYYDCNTGSECGQLKKVTNAAGHVTTYDDYDAVARLLQSTDANGVITTYTYNLRGWLLSMTQTPPTGTARVTAYEYDNVGQVIKTTLPDGAEQHYVYDAAHALREISDNLGNKVTYLYDAKGNRTQEQIFDPDGTLVRNTSTTYDARNFIKSVNNGGSVTQIVNDAVGNVSTQTDPNVNPATQHSFDGLDRLKNTVDALGNTSSYDYDVDDRLAQVTAPNTAQTSYVYDDLGNLLSETSPDRGVLTYVHDAAGNVVSSTDARGVTTNYSYDVLNRLINIDYDGTAEDVIYTYDSPINASNDCGYSIGRLCEVTDNGGHKRFQYDAFGNAVAVEHSVSGLSFVWQYEYDAANRVLAVTYPSGRQVNITRDAIGRLTDMSTTVELAQTQVVSNRSYQGDGLKKEHLLGNGLWSTQSYDQQGRLIAQSNADPTLKSYQYDANGNIVDLTDNAGQRLFTYDVLDRLTAANQPTTDYAYSYDANGNRLSTGINQQTTNLSYQANSNRLSQVGAATLSLDAAGNTVSDQGGNRTFEYNQAGRLSRIVENGAEVARYEYDSNGLRVKKITPTATTVYLYGFDGQLRMESDDSGTPQKEYLYADGELVAVIMREEGSPTISTPEDIVVEATAVLTPLNLVPPSAEDVSGNPIIATPDNPGPYPLGETTIVWTATDSSGLQSTLIQLVTVVDTTPPTALPPADISIYATEPLSIDLGNVSGTDIFGVTFENDAPALFPIGPTAVTWTAYDNNGNTATAIQTVMVNLVAAHCSAASNIALAGTATQSSEHSSLLYPASKAINGDTTDFSHTSSTEFNEAFWALSYTELKQFDRIAIHNRDGSSTDHRLRDIIVSIENSLGTELYRSELLNPENSLNGPDSITIDLPNLTKGHKIKVRRVPDPDLSGGGSTLGNGYVLSLGEVDVQGCSSDPISPVAPTLDDIAPQSAYQGAEFNFPIRAIDFNWDPLAYSVVGLPNGLNVDSQTGLISGSPTEGGVFDVTVNVSDGTFSDSTSFTLTVGQQCSSVANIAQNGVPQQSSDHSSLLYPASKAINGNTADFSHTSSSEFNEAFWSLSFSEKQQIQEVVLHNRDDCCESRLRDIYVSVDNESGDEVYRSGLLNSENNLSGPESITLELPALVTGNKLSVRRKTDPDLSGGGTTAGSGYVLSLAEVMVQGCRAPLSLEKIGPQGGYLGAVYSLQVEANDVNGGELSYSATGLPAGLNINSQTGLISGALATTGSYSTTVNVTDGIFTDTVSFSFVVAEASTQCSVLDNVALHGVATLSSTYVSASTGTTATKASNAINNILTDMIASLGSDANPTWTLDFSESKKIQQVTLHNRPDQYKYLMRDIIVSVEDDQGVEVYRSLLLNPENILGGPDTVTLDIPPLVTGSKLKVRRVADPDLSGGGMTTADSNMLSLSEIIVHGCTVPTPPKLSDVGPQGGYLGVAYTLQISANDVNNDTLSYSANGLPAGLTIDAQTGLVSGLPSAQGNFAVTVSVNDGVYTEAVSFTLVIADASTQCDTQINVASSGVASLSTTYVSAVTGTTATKASNAINGIFTDMIATQHADDNATWTLEFAQAKQIEQLVLHNRADEYKSLTRDIVITIENDSGAQIYQSVFLNPENVLDGPDLITLDIPPLILGSKVIVRRVADPDFSGGGSAAYDANMLSLAEVVVKGCAASQGGQ